MSMDYDRWHSAHSIARRGFDGLGGAVNVFEGVVEMKGQSSGSVALVDHHIPAAKRFAPEIGTLTISDSAGGRAIASVNARAKDRSKRNPTWSEDTPFSWRAFDYRTGAKLFGRTSETRMATDAFKLPDWLLMLG